jgi:hypothetical protein
MTIVMNMSGYEIEREPAAAEEYGDEVLCAGWNPQLALACETPVNKAVKPASLPAELAHANVDEFLQKMYLYQ